MKNENKTKCPDVVKGLMRVVNAVPRNIKLPDTKKIEDCGDQVYKKQFQEFTLEEALPRTRKKLSEMWLHQVKQLIGVDSYNVIYPFFQGASKYNSIQHWSSNEIIINPKVCLEKFENLRTFFDTLLQSRDFHQKQVEETGNLWTWRMFPVREIVILTNGKNGEIQFRLPDYFDAFQSCEIVRIRRCPICEKIFWAKRIDAPTCSRKCSNNFHQRNSRIKTYKNRLQNLEKMVAPLNPNSGLVSEKQKEIKKLKQKIKEEKEKNGNL